jgi:hypothetical protein
MKLFTTVIYDFLISLVVPLRPSLLSLMFVGKARRVPKSRGPERVDSCLTSKH